MVSRLKKQIVSLRRKGAKAQRKQRRILLCVLCVFARHVFRCAFFTASDTEALRRLGAMVSRLKKQIVSQRRKDAKTQRKPRRILLCVLCVFARHVFSP